MHKKLLLLFILPFFLCAQTSFKKGTLIQDDEIEDVLTEFCQNLFDAAKIKEKPKVYLVVNPEINAAATLSNTMIFNSGFILACRTVNEFVGVLAHEVSHIKALHPLLQGYFLKKNFEPGFLVMALGGLGAIFSGNPEFLIVGLSGGLSVMQRGFFKYSRGQEETADAGALELLERLNWPMGGLIDFFEVIMQKHGAIKADPYLSTHPFPEERIAKIRAYLSQNKRNAGEIPQKLKSSFLRIQAKLGGLVCDPNEELEKLKDDDSQYALYTKTIIYFRLRKSKEFLSSIDRLLKVFEEDSYLLELKGQYFLEEGKPKHAIELFKKARSLRPKNYGLDLLLSHAYIQLKDKVKDVVPLMKTYLHHNQESFLGWRFLATAYGKLGKFPEASFALAEQEFLQQDYKGALRQIEKAEKSSDPFVLDRVSQLKDIVVERLRK